MKFSKILIVDRDTAMPAVRSYPVHSKGPYQFHQFLFFEAFCYHDLCSCFSMFSDSHFVPLGLYNFRSELLPFLPPLHFSFSIPLSQVSFILSLTSFPTRHPSLLISDLYSPFFIYNLGTFMYLPFASPSVYPSPSSLSPIPFPLASLLPPSTSTSLLTSSSLWRMGSVLV